MRRSQDLTEESFILSQHQTQSLVRQYLHALAEHPSQYRPSHPIHDCIQHQNSGVSSQNVKTNHKCKLVQKFFQTFHNSFDWEIIRKLFFFKEAEGILQLFRGEFSM